MNRDFHINSKILAIKSKEGYSSDKNQRIFQHYKLILSDSGK